MKYKRYKLENDLLIPLQIKLIELHTWKGGWYKSFSFATHTGSYELRCFGYRTFIHGISALYFNELGSREALLTALQHIKYPPAIAFNRTSKIRNVLEQ